MATTHSKRLTWVELCKIAFGECGLKPDEFYELTLEEFIIYKAAILENRRNQLRQEFQHVRVLAYYTILPHLPKKVQKKKIDDLIPDIYEEMNQAPIANLKEHYKQILKRYKEAGLLN